MRCAILLLPIFLAGCHWGNVRPEDPCADRPIYKPYKIDVPQRPKLTTDTTANSTDGETVRAVESDYSKLMEYAQKLENLISSLPKDLSTKQ